MYNGPNDQPFDVQRHAPGQAPWQQAQAKMMHDAAAWQAYERSREASGGNWSSSPVQQSRSSQPYSTGRGVRMYYAIILVIFGFPTLGGFIYGAPVLAIMWGVLWVAFASFPTVIRLIHRAQS